MLVMLGCTLIHRQENKRESPENKRVTLANMPDSTADKLVMRGCTKAKLDCSLG